MENKRREEKETMYSIAFAIKQAHRHPKTRNHNVGFTFCIVTYTSRGVVGTSSHLNVKLFSS